MADTGKDASFSFAGTVYDETDCLSGFSLNDAINEVVYQCGGVDKGAAGTRTATFNASLALAIDDETKVSAFTPGTADTFEAHPGGDTANNIEIVATEALVVQANISAPVNGIISLDLQLRLNDITIGAAT